MPITPSAAIIRDRILDAAREHTPLEHEDADALAALLDRLIELEQAAPASIETTPVAEAPGFFKVGCDDLGLTPDPRVELKLQCADRAEADRLLRRLAKAIKPRKASRR